MKQEQLYRMPPRFATWLLNRFGGMRYRRALMGDLLELASPSLGTGGKPPL